ncbi:MAG: SDR family NAD(P)-dependent oxidoreductase [Steroidobacteraceae bacterium]
MNPVRFDGRVAVITGAGRGLGRAYARLLAERGAKVVVNDLGTEAHGHAPSGDHDYADGTAVQRPAESVTAEIRSAGGEAMADFSDVSDPSGGASLIETAVSHFGRIDIVINNAGISWARAFEETDLDGFLLQWKVHVGGSINVTRAAWSHFMRQGFGRVVNTTSIAALYGSSGQSEYATAKGAIHGLTRTLALEGAAHGIHVNAVAPAAVTRLVEVVMPKDWTDRARTTMAAERVAPLVAWLAHESCPSNGSLFQGLCGRVAEVLSLEPRGLISDQLTIEMVRDNATLLSSLDGLKAGSGWNAELDGGLFGKPNILGAKD